MKLFGSIHNSGQVGLRLSYELAPPIGMECVRGVHLIGRLLLFLTNN